jgi:hypothetical protein
MAPDSYREIPSKICPKALAYFSNQDGIIAIFLYGDYSFQ